MFFQDAKHEVVQSFEVAFIRSALEYYKGNISRTAPAIGMKRQALQQKLKEHGIGSRDLSLGHSSTPPPNDRTVGQTKAVGAASLPRSGRERDFPPT